MRDDTDDSPPATLHVMVVAHDDAMVRLAESAAGRLDVRPSVHRVEGFLLAMGDIATGGVPDALLGDISLMRGAAAATAQAIRRLAPSARLWLVGASGDEALADPALEAGFDGYLVAPVSTDDIAAAWYPHAFDRVTSSDAAASETAPETAPVTQSMAQPVAKAPTVESQQPIDAPLPDASAPSFGDADWLEPLARMFAARAVSGEASPPAEESPEPSPAKLGDVDLVDHLLGNRGGFRDVALAVLSGHAQFAGLAWAAKEQNIPAGHGFVSVTHRDHVYGVLHAPPPATSQALAPWAQWLGAWLAIDRRLQQLWDLALHDELTRTWNRRYFDLYLRLLLERAATERFSVTLMVFDIDEFKSYNDRFGHAAGDDILRETARLMMSVVREQDVVARIGGDEFGVIFWDDTGRRESDSEHPADVRSAAERFRQAVRDHQFPILSAAPAAITISGGLAGFPWDGRTAEHLMCRADAMLLQSKRQGKNVLSFGEGTQGNDWRHRPEAPSKQV